MSFDIHIKDDLKNIHKDNTPLQSPKLTPKSLEFSLEDEFATPTKAKKEKNKVEPKTPKKKSKKIFTNSIIKRKKSDLFNIHNEIDEGPLLSSPTLNIKAFNFKKNKIDNIPTYSNSNSISNSPSYSNSNFNSNSNSDYLKSNVTPPPLIKPNLAAFNKALEKTKIIYNSKTNNKPVEDDNRDSHNDNNDKNSEEVFSDTDSFNSFTNSTDNDSSFLFFNGSESDNKKYKSKNNIFSNLDKEYDFNEKKDLFSINDNSRIIKKKSNQGLLKIFNEDKEKSGIDKKERLNLIKEEFDIFNDSSNSNKKVSNFNQFEKTESPTFSLNVFQNNLFDNNVSFPVNNIFQLENMSQKLVLGKNFEEDDDFFFTENSDDDVDDVLNNNLHKNILSKTNLKSNTLFNSNIFINEEKKDEDKSILYNKKNNFTTEIWKNIFKYLTYKEILSMSYVSKQINLIIYDLDVWKNINIDKLSNKDIKSRRNFLEGLLNSKLSPKIETLIFNSDKNIPTPKIISLLVSNCKNLKSLILEDSIISLKHVEENFGKGERLISLKYLNINNCKNINYTLLKYLINGCPNLQKLECTNINVKSGEFGIIKELSNLQYLNISNNKCLCNLDIKSIYSNENKIKFLDISYCNSLTDRAISFILKNSQNLETIKINGSDMRITKKGLYLLSESNIRNIEFKKKN